MKKKLYFLAGLFTIVILGATIFLMNNREKTKIRKTPLIGLSMHETNDRWAKDVKYISKQIKKLGGNIIVKDARNNANNQYLQAKTLILENKVNVLIIVAENCGKATDIVELAHKHNVKVIAYDRLVLNCNLDYFICSDVINIGEKMGRYIKNIVPKGNYVLIGGGIYDENSKLIHAGILNELQKEISFNEIKIVFDKYTKNWEKSEAKEQIKSLISKNIKIDAIIASNDNLALGAIEAIEESKNKKYKLKDICVIGQDATLEGCKSIINNKLKMSIYKPVHLEAYTAANIAMKLAKNIKLKPVLNKTNNGKIFVPTIIIEYIYAIDIDNIDMTIIFDNYHTQKEVYN